MREKKQKSSGLSLKVDNLAALKTTKEGGQAATAEVEAVLEAGEIHTETGIKMELETKATRHEADMDKEQQPALFQKTEDFFMPEEEPVIRRTYPMGKPPAG